MRVLIADDEELVRHALRIFVESSAQMEVVGEATTGLDAVRQCAAQSPDIVLMDIQMPQMDGIEATRNIVTQMPNIRVIAITSFLTERHIVSALKAGATGYLVKDTPPAAVIQAILEVHEGRSVLSPQVTRELVATVQRDGEEGAFSRREPLTARETSIVEKLAQGKSNLEIAAELHIAEATVKSNLRRVMQKWEVRDRVQVLIAAVRNGTVSL
ncbi:response regulator transcription factor [Leucobacter viscericola]|uniref:Response regulator transcription factor n=1 Tax=Leucobacter viscericola TaxID=2714935 RepID=A0A6G7XJR2_9MICO|nr:response regulator transcription factor [Leucobacter viscericola]